jgi:hypothetical protein
MKIYIGNTDELISKEFHLEESTTINSHISFLEKSSNKHEHSDNNLYELIKNDLRKDHDLVIRTRFSDYEIGPKEHDARIVFDLFSINHNEFVCIDFGDNYSRLIESFRSNVIFNDSNNSQECIFIDTANNLIITPTARLKTDDLFFVLTNDYNERLLILNWYQIESDGSKTKKLNLLLTNGEVDEYCFLLRL